MKNKAVALRSNAAVKSSLKKKRGPASAPGRSRPCAQRQGLRWLGLFASFVAKTKEVASAAMSRRRNIISTK